MSFADAEDATGSEIPTEAAPASAVAAEAAQASEMSSAPVAQPEAANENHTEPPAAETPPAEHISLEDFPHSVGDVVTGRVLFSNARGARVAIHGVKGVLGYVLAIYMLSFLGSSWLARCDEKAVLCAAVCERTARLRVDNLPTCARA
jgi:hypothetical protein